MKNEVGNILLEKALKLAMEAHEGQVDKAGAPYIFHPIRVACRCKNDTERIAALLHDTVEDSDMTPERLLAEGFPRTIVEAVISLTHYDDEKYSDYVRRCSLNAVARAVKIHDLEDNMDISRLKQVTEKDLKHLNKYLVAYRFLLSVGEE